ncbi:GntR family transcriptional regulator [Pleomorphochaeta sp. DL1XJH-081]|jgi:GntR family transcriptional regulator|uniref:GntR family transcriptional regulator n=1 Tax=Pleomorphochaeta sp. DL1XJH-081 TaxID=3409690 RepID=UPI003BB659EF
MSRDKTPLYTKIEKTLRDQIISEKYKSGDLLPTEADLAKKFKASRTTVRNALANLEIAGFVWRKQGKGSVVKDVRLSQDLNYLSSFTESLEQRGVSVTTGMLSISLTLPPQKVRDEMNLNEYEKVYWLQRTRIADGIPIAYVNNYIRAEIVPGLENKSKLLEVHGLYKVLEEEYHLQIESCVETIETYISGPMDIEILQLERPEALFLSKRVTRSAEGKIFEYVTSVIRGGMHSYTVFLKDRRNIGN